MKTQVKKHFYLFLFLNLIFCSCFNEQKPRAIAVETQKEIETPYDVLKALMTAQDNFYRLTGRFSMTTEALINHKFLDPQIKKILENKSSKFSQWHFKSISLPFPDEDVSWCKIVRGPNGHIILAAFNGIWERTDGQCPLDAQSLPPSSDWKKVE